jgi:hypothetical protein
VLDFLIKKENIMKLWDGTDVIMGLITGLICGFIIGSSVSEVITCKDMQQSAIKAGCAKFICNEKTGESTFTYITNSITK